MLEWCTCLQCQVWWGDTTKYKDVWSVHIDEAELSREREPGNPRVTLAIAVIE